MLKKKKALFILVPAFIVITAIQSMENEESLPEMGKQFCRGVYNTAWSGGLSGISLGIGGYFFGEMLGMQNEGIVLGSFLGVLYGANTADKTPYCKNGKKKAARNYWRDKRLSEKRAYTLGVLVTAGMGFCACAGAYFY